MKAVIKREFRNYLKNPILWAGFIVVVIGIYQMLNPYLKIRYIQSEKEAEQLKKVNLSDADIMDGYVPSTAEQQLELGYETIEKTFVEGLGTSKEEAAQIVEGMKQKNMSKEEAVQYLSDKYSYRNAEYAFEDASIHKGTKEEINTYIKQKVSENPFSFYFARKFADSGGLYMGFFSAILLAFLFIRDTRKDTYELLHTKPVSPGGYICGKVIGGFLAILSVLGMLNVIFGILCEIYGRKAGLPVRFWDIIAATVLYIVPNVLMIASIYTFISLLFKNPLPAVPMIFLYIIYSNMGSYLPDGSYVYQGRPLAVMVRFPGNFFETSPPSMVMFNQIFLIIASFLLIMVSVVIWKRRRV